MTTAAVGLRYRIVTAQDSAEHVSSVVLNEDEALEALDWEAHVHEAGGWTVERLTASGGYLITVTALSPRGVHRRIFTRSFSPMTDTPEGGENDRVSH